MEAVEAPREDVQMIRRIPQVERNKNMKIQDMLFSEIIVLFVLKIEELVDNIEVNCWRKRKEKERPLLSSLATVS